MKTFHFFSDNIINNLGWTLLHTLWQGALLFILIKLLQKLVSEQRSSLRYTVNCGALLLMLISFAVTFTYLHISSLPALSLVDKPLIHFTENATEDYLNAVVPSTFIQEMNNQMPWLISAWIVGVFMFSIRFFSGLFYIRFLRAKKIEVNAFWARQLSKLSNQIGVNQLVVLAESVYINKPIVVGYIKPLILLPIGLLTGLPQEQVEAILLHELTHIKRYDYLINIIQSVVEIVLFFNPFVWLISKMIREEREHCCDDQVIKSSSARMAYAKALANLEAIRLDSTPTLALALNKNKYQVINRIKRIMETSVNKNQTKMRPFILVLAIAIVLICTSWLSIGLKNVDENKTLNKVVGNAIGIADTTKKQKKDKDRENEKAKANKDNDKGGKESSASYSRKSVTTFDKDGTPHEEVIENFEGDESLRPLFSTPDSYSFTMSGIPSFPSIPSMPFDMYFSYSFDGDTIPRKHFFSPEEQEKWEEFGRDMTERFERFGYENEEFARMMEEWSRKFENSFSNRFDENFYLKMEKLHEQLENLKNEDFTEKLDKGLKELEQQLEKMEERLKENKNELRLIEENMEAFEQELSEQLIKDGYLRKGEKVNSMNWGDEKLTINGIKIKDKDISKYEELSKKYFKGKRGFYSKD